VADHTAFPSCNVIKLTKWLNFPEFNIPSSSAARRLLPTTPHLIILEPTIAQLLPVQFNWLGSCQDKVHSGRCVMWVRPAVDCASLYAYVAFLHVDDFVVVEMAERGYVS
jgi:hypothetical protein